MLPVFAVPGFCAIIALDIVSGEAAACGLWVSVGVCGMSVSVVQGVARLCVPVVV